MTRLLVCSLVLSGAAFAARAGELDKESGPAKSIPATAKAAVPAPTELDNESPAAAWHHYGYRGYYGGYRGYGGWGYGGYRPSYGFGYGGYRGYGGWGYPGFGYGSFYRPYYSIGFGFGYPGFYSPYRYGGYGYGRYW